MMPTSTIKKYKHNKHFPVQQNKLFNHTTNCVVITRSTVMAIDVTAIHNHINLITPSKKKLFVVPSQIIIWGLCKEICCKRITSSGMEMLKPHLCLRSVKAMKEQWRVVGFWGNNGHTIFERSKTIPSKSNRGQEARRKKKLQLLPKYLRVIRPIFHHSILQWLKYHVPMRQC